MKGHRMKSVTALIFAALLAAGNVSRAADPDDHKPRHGGIVAEVRHIDYELVVNADTVQLYVRDHGKSLDISKASAKLTLLVGIEKQELELKPTAGKLEARGVFKIGPGAKAVAVVTIPGRAVATARFSWK